MLQKKHYITPTTRFANIWKFFDFHQINKNKKKMSKHNHLLLKKRFYTTNQHKISLISKYIPAFILQTPLYNKKPFQLFFLAKTLYNQQFILPGTDLSICGHKVYNLTNFYEFTKPDYIGSKVLLDDLPFYIHVNNILNNTQNKWTFIKSSGTCGLKLKAKKTVKLILVQLPSEKHYFFKKTTSAFIGKNYNFFNQKFIEGKWSFSIKLTKMLHVRGVAKNPVDHPNGGRTKAKQPEKSPWGWIAKKSK